MAARLGARKLPRYTMEFKVSAVRLTQIPGTGVPRSLRTVTGAA